MVRVRSLPNPMRMRRSLTLQLLTETDAADGGVTQSWANVSGDDATRRASVKGLGGKEFFQASQTVAEASHRIETRYVPSLVNAADATLYRWIDGSLVYNIIHVLNVDERNSVTECLVKESSI